MMCLISFEHNLRHNLKEELTDARRENLAGVLKFHHSGGWAYPYEELGRNLLPTTRMLKTSKVPS
jgi:hypothetical protein